MTTNHDDCCCTETLNDLEAISAAYEINQALTNYYLAFRSAYWAANCDRDELTSALAAAIAERDRARDTAARLEAELARGFRVAAPDITLSRDHRPTTPGEAESVDGIVQIRPGSENTSGDTYPHENPPESPGALIPTVPSNNGRSGRRIPVQDASTVPALTVGPHDVEHLYIWGHDEPICTIVTPRDDRPQPMDARRCGF